MTSQKVFNSPNTNEVTPHTPERVVLLRRPVFWSYLFASLIVGAGIGIGAWMAIARFDQTVLATGTLELQGDVKEIKAPANGVVQEIHVKDGEAVTPNEPLATFKSTAPEADLESLKKEKQTLIQQNQIYENALKGSNPSGESEATSLIQLRTQLVKENQYYQALVADKNLESEANGEFDTNHQRLLAASSPELQSRASAARLRIQELEKQLSKVQEKLAAAQKLQAENPEALGQLSQVSKEVQTEVERRSAQQQQVKREITQVKEELQNTFALAAKDVRTKIAQNQQRIAEIDSHLRQAQQDNQKRIAEIDAKLSQPQYQQLKSPIEGVVFDLQPPAPGYVANTNQTLLTIVPNNSLVASVYLKEKDIGFVKEGMDVQVTMASFPKSELGSVEGKVVWVGSDVLPPVPGRPYHAIPARIQLKRPSLDANGKPIRLQSGMAVNCSIILPQQRTALDVVRDALDRKVKSAEGLFR